MFSTLLPEVISDHIFPFLHVNDLLRLRRVCTTSKDLADDYLRVYEPSREVVRLNTDNLSNFLALPYPLPLTRFHLDKSSWDGEQMQTFLDRYGDKITHLEIYRLDIPIESPRTVQFFEGLQNLNELEITWLCSSPKFGSDAEEEEEEEEDAQFEPPEPNLNLPSTFKKLRHLHVTNAGCRPQLLSKFMEECSNHLEYINHPGPWEFHATPGEEFDCVKRIVEKRNPENPDTPNLKFVNLEDFWVWEENINDEDVETYARRFHELVTTCSAHNVKLQNVHAELIEGMMQLDTPDRGLRGDKISRCVVSIKKLTPSVFRLELPLLENIDFTGISLCSMPKDDFERHPWENLKELKLWVDSKYLGVDSTNDVSRPVRLYDFRLVSVSRLFEFLFNGIRREKLESLDLSYLFPTNPYPSMTSVCSSCPNLKKLNLQNWSGSNRDVAQLWGNLPLLQDVTFKECDNLGDAAFIGDDVTRPAILNATRLKSLTFRSLEKMPGITNALFQSALCHMPLKTLHLKSWDPLSWITLAGLESLLTGKFAETIEKFPLKGRIKLEGVTDEQLAELEGRFRSSQM